MMKSRKRFTTLVAGLVLASAMPTVVSAAPIELTTSFKSSLDKTIAAADWTQANEIGSLYNELLSLQRHDQDWDTKIKSIHTGNEETLTGLSKQIKQIDAAKVDKLKAAVAATKEQYKPLFAHYSLLNKQIAAARKLKEREFTSLLSEQVSALKIPVQLARIDIKTKENEWQAAKDKADKKMKEIRGTLAAINPLKEQIKAQQSAIKKVDTSVTPLWSTFNQAVKKGDAPSVLNKLTSLVSLLRQIDEGNQKVFVLESTINDVLTAAKAQMP